MSAVMPLQGMQAQPMAPPMTQPMPEPVTPADDKPEFDYKQMAEEARERYRQSDSDDGGNRAAQREDTEFVYTPGKQWSSYVVQRRKNWKEPCLEFNQLKQFVNQVVNDQRQNRPSILVHPAHDGAAKETADILQGMTRFIEYQSKAEAVYDNGFQLAVVGGRGWWRVLTEYETQDYGSGNFWNQKIVIAAILDTLAVRADLNYTMPDGSDRNWVFVEERISKKLFAEKWPDAEPISYDSAAEKQTDSEELIIADYYRRVCKKRQYVMMSDGAKGWKDEMPKPPSGVTILREREVETWSVQWFKLAGGDQKPLEEYKCPGDKIPVICTAGDDILVEGKRCYQGLIRQARDAQSMFNYGMTQQAIHLALTPLAPWVAPHEAIVDFQEIWKNANTEKYSFLPFKHKDAQGEAIPAPTRTMPSLPDQGWANFTVAQTGVMRSTIGMYENSLGMKGTEVSGKAIMAREKQGDVGTYHFVDNRNRAIALTGQIVVDWIPVYYDTERIVQIIGPDGKAKSITINQAGVAPAAANDPAASDPATDQAGALQAIKHNDVTVGKFAVVIETGPGYATKRQETADKLMSLVNSFPLLMQAGGDIVVRALDVDQADQLADRMKAMLPPPIQAMEKAREGGGKPLDPQVMAQMQQMQKHLQEATQALQGLQAENEKLKAGEMSKIQIAQASAQADKEIAAGKAQASADASIQEANIRAAAEVERAHIEAQTQKDIAIIRRRTDLETTHMDNVTDIKIESMQPEPESPASSEPPAE